MGLIENEALFENFKTKKQDNETKKNEKGGLLSDERFVKFETGNSFKFRLVYYDNTDTPTKREGPFVERFTHGCPDANGDWQSVVCPTTFFPKSGFKKCPMCEQSSKFYRAWKDSESATDKELYYQHRRRFSGFAIVYVINDPVNPENNGHCKLIRFGKRIRKFLNKNIFGVIEKTYGQEVEKEDPVDNDELVGFDAFRFGEAGVNFLIDVTTVSTDNGDFNNYDCNFSRKPSSIEVDAATIEAEIKELNFDDLLSETSEEGLLKHYQQFVLDSTEAVAKALDTVAETVSNVPSPELASTPEESSAPVQAVSAALSDDDIADILKDVVPSTGA